MSYLINCSISQLLNQLHILLSFVSADPEEDVLEFHLEPVPPGAAPPRVTQAKLFVLIRWRKPPGKRNKKNANKKNKNKRKNRKERITLKIYKVNDTSEVPKQQRIADLRVMMHHTKWQKLIIPTWVVQDAFDSADHRLLLRVVCEECGRYGNSGPKPVLFYRKKQRKRSNKKIKVQGIKTVGEPVSRDRRQDPSVRASKVHKRGPFLQIRTRQRSQRRVRRGAAEEDSTCTAATVRDVTTDVPCGISSMYVDFTEFGWDWIISPKYFYTNFCFGTCSAENWSENEGKVSENQYNRDISNSDEDNGQMTQNANFVESVDDTRRCCRAVETQPLTLQYYTETGNVKSRQIENLIVTKCGCY